MIWRLYEDVAHPEGWIEIWAVDSWTDHLREADRLSDFDKAVLARVAPFVDADAPLPSRYIAIDPAARGRRNVA